ncbi:hypothetical protein LWI28_024038 [Acer negundo]|uniref:Uncharacterized protein n=1 Tax=Acer negundo TaxID=4023 RepID=A0AAD5NP00_ACENE|nr:hypothetical protein LWI28_024038 [Acer negundo]
MALFLYPDHEGWINVRINSKSRQHCDILIDIDEVLGKLHVSEEFKQGPFGHYLVHMTPTPAEQKQAYYNSIDMDFVCSSVIHKGCTARAYQTVSITDDQRTLFLNNESPKSSAKPNSMDDPDQKEVTYKSMCRMMTKVLFDVLPKALNDMLPKVLPQALNDILSKVKPTFLEKVLHQNLYNVHGTASDSSNIKDKAEEVDNKDSEVTKPNGHAPKVNECVNKKDKPDKVDNKDSKAPKRDEHAPKVDEFEVTVEAHTRSPISCKRTIDLESYRSPIPNLMVPTAEQSLIILENRPANYPERDLETRRKRKREKFLNSRWIDLEKRKKRKRVKAGQIHDISDDDHLLDPKYDAFLKTTGDDIL